MRVAFIVAGLELFPLVRVLILRDEEPAAEGGKQNRGGILDEGLHFFKSSGAALTARLAADGLNSIAPFGNHFFLRGDPAREIVGTDGDAAPVMREKFSSGLPSPPPKNSRLVICRKFDAAPRWPFNKKNACPVARAGACAVRELQLVFSRRKMCSAFAALRR